MVQGSVRYLMGPVMAQDFRYQREKRLEKLLPLYQKMEHHSAYPAKRQEYLPKHLDSKKTDPIISLLIATQRDIRSPKVVLEQLPPS